MMLFLTLWLPLLVQWLVTCLFLFMCWVTGGCPFNHRLDRHDRPYVACLIVLAFTLAFLPLLTWQGWLYLFAP